MPQTTCGWVWRCFGKSSYVFLIRYNPFKSPTTESLVLEPSTAISTILAAMNQPHGRPREM